MSKFEELVSKVKSSEPDFDEVRENAKLRSLFTRKQAEEIVEEIEEERKVKVWVIVLAVIGVIAIGCLVGYLIYRKNKPDYLDDFDDEFEGDDEDFFEDEE